MTKQFHRTRIKGCKSSMIDPLISHKFQNDRVLDQETRMWFRHFYHMFHRKKDSEISVGNYVMS